MRTTWTQWYLQKKKCWLILWKIWFERMEIQRVISLICWKICRCRCQDTVCGSLWFSSACAWSKCPHLTPEMYLDNCVSGLLKSSKEEEDPQADTVATERYFIKQKKNKTYMKTAGVQLEFRQEQTTGCSWRGTWKQRLNLKSDTLVSALTCSTLCILMWYMKCDCVYNRKHCKMSKRREVELLL